MKRQPTGFTLVELLVVITIISILMGLLIPAVNAAREVARKNQCSVRVKNLALAAIQHENTKGKFPSYMGNYGVFPADGAATGVDRSDPANYAGSVPLHVKAGGYGIPILPWLDAQPTYEHWTDDSYPVIADAASTLGRTIAVGASTAGAGYHTLAAPNLPNFQCPSNPVTDAQSGRNSYITNNGLCFNRTANAAMANGGMAGIVVAHETAQGVGSVQGKNNGVFKQAYVGANPAGGFGAGPPLTIDDLKDGLTNTALYSENVQALPWHFAGFLNGGEPATPNLIPTNAMFPRDLDGDVAGVGPQIILAQFVSGMVWHMEDKDNMALPVPTGIILDIGDDSFIRHKINGGGTTAQEDIFTLQMTPANCYDLARPSSAHVDGVNMGFADGATRYISSKIDMRVYQALLTPRGKSSHVPWPEFVLTDQLEE